MTSPSKVGGVRAPARLPRCSRLLTAKTKFSEAPARVHAFPLQQISLTITQMDDFVLMYTSSLFFLEDVLLLNKCSSVQCVLFHHV